MMMHLAADFLETLSSWCGVLKKSKFLKIESMIPSSMANLWMLGSSKILQIVEQSVYSKIRCFSQKNCSISWQALTFLSSSSNKTWYVFISNDWIWSFFLFEVCFFAKLKPALAIKNTFCISEVLELEMRCSWTS